MWASQKIEIGNRLQYREKSIAEARGSETGKLFRNLMETHLMNGAYRQVVGMRGSQGAKMKPWEDGHLKECALQGRDVVYQVPVIGTLGDVKKNNCHGD